MLSDSQSGGLAGRFELDAKVRPARISKTCHAHIGGMDTFALALKIAHQLKQDGVLSAFIRERYSGYDNGVGHRIEAGKTDFKELEKYALDEGEPELRSGRQEKLENIMNHYLFGGRAQ
jgi:xylose isomerase